MKVSHLFSHQYRKCMHELLQERNHQTNDDQDPFLQR